MGIGGTKIEKSQIVIDFENISKNQYFCPGCNRIPEILNIHSDSGHIELLCKIHGVIDLTVENYLNQMQKKFSDIKKKEEFEYCCYCKSYFCEKCLIDKSVHRNDCQREKDMLLHCMECEEDFCEKKIKENHKYHKTLELNELRNDVRIYREIILKKNILLSNIINLNKIILNSYEYNPNNYHHMKSIINLGKTIEEENSKDSNKFKRKSIISLKEKFSISLDGNERILDLRNRNIEDEGLKLMSRIKFKNLKILDISKNNIKNIEPLSYMDLPNLKYLKMNDNKIENIEPITQIKSNELKEICLMNNNIKEISPDFQLDYPKLERIRIEGNPLNPDSEIFQKYSKILLYKSMSFEEFNNKYKCNFSPNDRILDLHSRKLGDEILNDLYLIIPEDNKINQLSLDDNNLHDISIINRIPLYNLSYLDLSVNKITNLKFLKEMILKNLRRLYLEHNNINDFSPLLTYLKNYPNLKIITFKNRFFNIKTKNNKELLKMLNEKKIEYDTLK